MQVCFKEVNVEITANNNMVSVRFQLSYKAVDLIVVVSYVSIWWLIYTPKCDSRLGWELVR